jgi:2-isopropylmalate synthase
VLKRRDTYELFDPGEIGHPTGTEIVLGKLSGRAGFSARARRLGFRLGAEAAELAFARFQALADRVGEVGDDAVREICAQLRDAASPASEVAPRAGAAPAQNTARVS